MTKVKFCGITNYEDAELALDLGADALGFNFSLASSRYIDPLDAKLIVRRLPPSAWYVGVFVNSRREEIDKIARTVGLDTIQLHGDETMEFCQNWNELRVIKALRLGVGGANIEDCVSYAEAADFLLLDHFSSKEYGGTGKQIDENLLNSVSKEIFAKTFLSGGLTPENVGQKVKTYNPYAVDVASGIEFSAGKKSLAKMSAFIKAIR